MKTKYLLLAAALAVSSAVTAAPTQVGSDPLPVVHGITVTTQMSSAIDQTLFQPVYSYTYTLSSPATNTGNIWNIQIDVSAPRNHLYNIPGDFLLPRGAAGQVFFGSVQDETFGVIVFGQSDPSIQTNVIPFGITAPTGWFGSLTVNRTGGFFAQKASLSLKPGHVVTGLTMTSLGLPTIRTMSLSPDWVYESDEEEGNPTDSVTAAQTEQALEVHVPVLAPGFASAGTDEQLDQLKVDINTMVQLGWISSATLATTLQNQLQTARNAFDQQGGFNAIPAFNTILTTVQNSTSSQRTNDAYELLSINLQAFIDAQPPDDEGPVPSPAASIITPSATPITAAAGTPVTVVEQIVDRANNNAPLEGIQSVLRVISGPDEGMEASPDLSDANGQISLTLNGQGGTGVDVIEIVPEFWSAEEGPYATTTIVWTGGPDLQIASFTPQVVRLGNQGSFMVTDTTINRGNTSIGSTTTGYFLSATSPVDPTTAFFLGSRSVPALAAGASNHSETQMNVPTALDPGIYFMVACANYDKSQVEANYANNCQTNELVASVVPDANRPPVCSSAIPSQSLLWPPNHQFVGITINGVTDPNNQTPTIAITGIQQDEPVNAKGDGNTTPDGNGIGTPTAQVRSERSGTAKGGRLYFITFKATDSGGSCTGTVTVGVPHDQGQHNMPTDNGQRYDSTASH